MKRVFSIFLCLLLLGALAGCTPTPLATPVAGQSLRIGISMYNQYDTFITLLMERFHHYAKEKQQADGLDITIIQESANGNQMTQNNQVESFIKSGCDIICVNLVDRTDVAFILDKIEAAGVPTIFFNREPVAEDLQRSDNLYYVGADARQSGQLQGQLVLAMYQAEQAWQEAQNPPAADDASGTHASDTAASQPAQATPDVPLKKPLTVDKNDDGIVQYVMLEGEAGHQDAIFRTEYSVGTLTNADIPVERLDGAIASWARARAETKMSQWLNQYGCDLTGREKCIEVVFANNDDMALGAIDALEKAAIPQEDWPVIVGVDGTREGLAAVAAGKMAGTVLNNADGQARAMLELACSLYTGADLPQDISLESGKYIRLPYETVTLENVQEYIAVYN